MRAALALLALTMTAACGTTVPLASQPNGVPGGDGLSVLPSEPAATAPGQTLTADPVTAGGPSAATQGVPVQTAAEPSAVPGVVRQVPRGGTIAIGYATHKDGASTVASVGISGGSPGDAEVQMRTVVNELNKRGGILGRKVVAVPHDYPTLENANNPDGVAAAACADWKDKRVFAVVNVTPIPSLVACLSKAGIPLVSSLGISSPASLFSGGLPGVYAPSAMSIDRSVRAVIDRLVARRFFTGWDAATGQASPATPVKIAMQSFDTPDGQHVVDVTRKALAAHGLKLDLVESHSTSVADNSSSTSSAVLQFRAQGITHVIDANLIFFQTADSQGFHPRYVIQDTINTPALLAQNVGPSQLRGSMGAGYLPAYEVDGAKDVSPEATHCKAIMRAAGEDMTATVALAFALHTCDAVFWVEKALTAAGVVSVTGLRDGAVRLGVVPSHVTYGSAITPSRRDGASRIRDFAYDEACGCFRHTSATTYAVP